MVVVLLKVSVTTGAVVVAVSVVVVVATFSEHGSLLIGALKVDSLVVACGVSVVEGVLV